MLLREVGHIFQVSIEQDTDKHIADSDWAYVQESILKLKDTNQSSVWDDKVPLSCLFNSNNEVSKAFTWSNDTRIDADKVHDIANEIYGATVDEGLLEGVLTEIMQSTFAEVSGHSGHYGHECVSTCVTLHYIIDTLSRNRGIFLRGFELVVVMYIVNI